ncbi:lysophosphatidic acid receptor 6-like [Brienomyrus brachyistius]|uniref:lysophosphatidic acid receptor 6-like n=1 Tax=Brienomyrus brachyistius TaxID=42636 RepID=UPI0020B2F4FB|nr:lysophosphatidic acid receptor 6-like [Brienomyrus brachyistius]XP_048884958.1 lysophosphatidic acid receptor 6-like [Brienomyrus brachyistius]
MDALTEAAAVNAATPGMTAWGNEAWLNLTEANGTNLTESCEAHSADFQYLMLPIVYSIVFVLSMIGNLTALAHFLHSQSVTQPSHVFLVNLCAIDLLFTLTLPLNVLYHVGHNHWPFGEEACKVNGALFFGNLYGSSLFLMLISLDRYLAVVHPLRALRLRHPKYRILISCSVWLALISVILYLTLRVPATRPFPSGLIACMENFSSDSWHGRVSAVILLASVLSFFLPLSVIATCYPLIACRLLSRQAEDSEAGGGVSAQRGSRRMRRRALRMVLLVLAVFLLCFTPYHLNQLLHTLARMDVLAGCPILRFTYPMRRITMALCSFNACLDPLVYCLASESFQWRQAWRCCRCDRVSKRLRQTVGRG